MSPDDQAARETRYRLGDRTICVGCLGDASLVEQFVHQCFAPLASSPRCPNVGNWCTACLEADPPGTGSASDGFCFEHHALRHTAQ